MTATDSTLDDVLLAVALTTQHGGTPNPAAVMSMMPLGTPALAARIAFIEAQLLRYIDEAGLTAAGRERVNACPTRRAILNLLAAPEADLQVAA